MLGSRGLLNGSSHGGPPEYAASKARASGGMHENPSRGEMGTGVRAFERQHAICKGAGGTPDMIREASGHDDGVRGSSRISLP